MGLVHFIQLYNRIKTLVYFVPVYSGCMISRYLLNTDLPPAIHHINGGAVPRLSPFTGSHYPGRGPLW